MLLAGATLLAWAGLGAFAFAMGKHYSRACNCRIQPRVRIVLQLAGAAFLGGALAAAIVRDGISFGILLWVALVGLVGMGFVLLLAYRPRLAFIASGVAAVSMLALLRAK